jgi:signal transduction histidine kinase
MVDFENAVRNNDMIGVLLIMITILTSLLIYLYLDNKKITKNYEKDIKRINNELTIKEDERIKKSRESEKELMDVLNSVSTIIKMADQADKYQTEKILTAIKNLGERLMDKIETLKNIK